MRHIKRSCLIILFILLVILIICIVAIAPRAREWARSIETMGKIGVRLSMGMTRTQVEQEMGQDLKRRYYCDLGNTVGVYLIGSKDPKRAGILHLRYARVGEQEILQKIEGLDPDMLFQFEGHGCTVLEY